VHFLSPLPVSHTACHFGQFARRVLDNPRAAPTPVSRRDPDSANDRRNLARQFNVSDNIRVRDVHSIRRTSSRKMQILSVQVVAYDGLSPPFIPSGSNFARLCPLFNFLRNVSIPTAPRVPRSCHASCIYVATEFSCSRIVFSFAIHASAAQQPFTHSHTFMFSRTASSSSQRTHRTLRSNTTSPALISSRTLAQRRTLATVSELSCSSRLKTVSDFRTISLCIVAPFCLLNSPVLATVVVVPTSVFQHPTSRVTP
jgi:hypothetical protein